MNEHSMNHAARGEQAQRTEDSSVQAAARVLNVSPIEQRGNLLAPLGDVPGPTAAALDVLAERRRQVEAEGWTQEHDDEMPAGMMSVSAGCYAIGAGYALQFSGGKTSICPAPEAWPLPLAWWKPTTSRRDLVKAAALILAEIERLDRAQEETSKL